MEKTTNTNSKQVYTISVEIKDGVTTMTRRNDGFNPMELLGIMEIA